MSVQKPKIPVNELKEMMLNHYTIDDLDKLFNGKLLMEIHRKELDRLNIERSIGDKEQYDGVKKLVNPSTELTLAFNHMRTASTSMMRKYKAREEGCSLTELGRVTCILCHRDCKCVNKECNCELCEKKRVIRANQAKEEMKQQYREKISYYQSLLALLG
jgi:hypothetical protein